jgi:membrane associated rhomboid family serine protease
MIPIRDSLRSTKTPHVVYTLIGVNILVFLYQLSLSEQAAEFLTHHYGLIPLRYSAPEWAQEHGLSPTNYLPFLTSMFLHDGWLHIIFNMWPLFIFGSSLEARMGSGLFLLFYILCGLAAIIVHASFNRYSNLSAIGASGAIAGVIGAYAVAFPYARLVLIVPIFLLPLFFEAPAMLFAVLWFLVQFMQGAEELAKPTVGGVAWWAHVGGFMAGMALAPFFPAHRINAIAPPNKPSESPNESVSAEKNEP